MSSLHQSVRVKGFGNSTVSSFSLQNDEAFYAVVGEGKIDFLLSPAQVHHKHKLDENLKRFCAVVKWEGVESDRILIQCSDTNRDLMNWRTDATEVVRQFFDDIDVQMVEDNDMMASLLINKMKGNASVCYKKKDSNLVLVGPKYEVQKLYQSLENFCDEVPQIKEILQVKPHEAYMFKYCGLSTTLQSDFPVIRFETNAPKSEIIIHGPANEKDSIREAMLSTKEQLRTIRTFENERVCDERLHLLKKCEINESILSKYRKVYYEIINMQSLTVYAFCSGDKDNFIALVKEEIMVEEFVFGEGQPVSDVCDIGYIEVRYNGTISINFEPVIKTIIVTSLREDFDEVVEEISKWVTIEKAQKVMDLYEPHVYNILQNKFHDEIEDIVGKHYVTVWKNSDLGGFMMKGSEKSIIVLREDFEKLVSQIKSMKISVYTHVDPDNADRRTEAICNKNGCTYERFSKGRHSDAIRRIIVHHGDISNLDVDVIVLSSNQRLQLLTGLAKVISKKGGKEIHRECDVHVAEHGPVPPGDVFISSGGKLNCFALAHVVSPFWEGGQKDERIKLGQAISRCLTKLDKQRFRSVAFPALFTKSFRYETETSVRTIINTVNTHFGENPESSIRTVIFCDTKLESTQVFLKNATSTKWRSKVLLDHNIRSMLFQNCMLSDRGSSFKPTSEIDDIALAPQKVGSMTLRVYMGDITKANVDVIVKNSKNENGSEKGKARSPSMVMKDTDDGMGCNAVLHVDILQAPRKSWLRTIHDTLMLVDNKKLTTVAFPAIESGCAEGGVTELFEVLDGRTGGLKLKYLKEVHMVLCERTLLREVHRCLRQLFLDSGHIWMPTPPTSYQYSCTIHGVPEEAVNATAQEIKDVLTEDIPLVA